MNILVSLCQDDAKRLEDLEILRATLQPLNGLHMTCTPRV